MLLHWLIEEIIEEVVLDTASIILNKIDEYQGLKELLERRIKQW
jgi:hypothetical protein